MQILEGRKSVDPNWLMGLNSIGLIEKISAKTARRSIAEPYEMDGEQETIFRYLRGPPMNGWW